MKLAVARESWPLAEPFETARECQTTVETVLVTLTADDGCVGRAEAVGVSEHGETADLLVDQLRAIGAVPDRAALQTLLPPGGARNALDCALWDLAAKQAGVRFWALTGDSTPTALTTAFTLGLANEAETVERAKRAAHLPLLKLKLDAERHLDIVRIVREHAPHARLIVDANQAWSRKVLERLLPHLMDAGVELIEQPVPTGEDEQLRGLASPIPLGADESCTDLASLAALNELYQVINIKLDKTGGLTAALQLAEEARRRGLAIMVGCMCGTSLGMAAAWPIAMRSRWIDLDGPLLLSRDRDPGLAIENGVMQPPAKELAGMTGSTEMALNAARIDFTSKVNGTGYRLLVSTPAGKPPERGWPVVYLIDGSLHFGIAVDTMRIQARWPDTHDAVVVGIAYQTDSVATALDVRNIDLTPPIDQSIIDGGWMRKMGMNAEGFGGMDAYLTMLEEEAKPRVAAHVPIDPDDQTLMGHSLGGLTTLAVLFNHTDRFQRYAAISPSIYFADNWVLHGVDAFAERIRKGDAKAKLFLSAGEYEEARPLKPAFPKTLPISEADFEEMMDACRMVSLPTELAARLSPLRGASFDMKFVVHPEEDHRSVVPAGIAGGIYYNLYRPE